MEFVKRENEILRMLKKLIEEKLDFIVVGGYAVSGLASDLLGGSLVCRATEASWSFHYIKKYSIEAVVTGIETSVTCRIPEKELLIAFKVHSARRTDIRDIIMLRDGSDLENIMMHLRKGKTDALKSQMDRIVEALNDRNLVDSLKGVFTLTVNVAKQIEN